MKKENVLNIISALMLKIGNECSQIENDTNIATIACEEGKTEKRYWDMVLDNLLTDLREMVQDISSLNELIEELKDE